MSIVSILCFWVLGMEKFTKHGPCIKTHKHVTTTSTTGEMIVFPLESTFAMNTWSTVLKLLTYNRPLFA